MAAEPQAVVPPADPAGSDSPAPAPAPDAPVVHPAAVEAEEFDNDSSLDTDSIASSTTSLSSSVLKFREENGRTFHAYKDGLYAFPNDEPEKDRLDLQHHIFALTFDGKLFTAPIPEKQVLHRVLDIGTGTGIWAIDFADEHPESVVLGVDLSPIQPSFIPPNLSFQVDDVEAPWTYTEKFDFIYSRMMIGSLADVPKFMTQSLENLNPGGWIEMIDITFPVKLNDGEFPPNSAHLKWAKLFEEGCLRIGRRADCARLYKEQLISAGFTNVEEKRFIWAINRWPKDKKLKEIGMWELENMTTGIQAMSIGIFTRVLGWSKLELDIFLAEVIAEMKDTRTHTYYELFAVTAQKPQ